MKLEQFREVADEKLHELVVDERMLQKVHQKMCAVEVQRRPAISRRAMTLAAACIAVMLISGGVLLGTMGVGMDKAPTQEGITMAVKEPIAPANSASTLSAHTQTSQYIDGTVLSYSVAEIGEYCDGAAPALSSSGLYGIVNQDGVWVVKAKYDEVVKIENGKAVVILQGAEQNIEIPLK